MIPYGLLCGRATSDVILTPPSASINDLKAFTTLQLVKVTTLTTSLMMWGKRPGTANRLLRLQDTLGNLDLRIRRTAGALQYTTSDTPIALIGTLRWVATTYDDALGTNAAHIYHGPYGGALTESTYSVQTEGTGASDTSDAANGWAWMNGQVSPYAAALKGIGYVAMLWPQALSLSEIVDVIANRSVRQRAVVDYVLAANGTGPVWDRSGTGNHGLITGAVPVSDGVPGMVAA